MAFLVIYNFGAFTQYLFESEVSSRGPSHKYMSENLIMELIFFFKDGPSKFHSSSSFFTDFGSQWNERQLSMHTTTNP